MTPIEALQAVYERGVKCRDCEYYHAESERERLSGCATKIVTWRGCDILESQNYKFSREPTDCPGVEELV